MKAFPNTYKHPTSGLFIEEQGMDLRDYFAAQALMACTTRYDWSNSMAVKEAYEIADAMLKEREKPNE
jgi:hypothetical protein